MRRFESLVMSVNEPDANNTLWLRQKKNTIKDTATNTISPAGMSIWWFSEQGWKPLIDLDTRYDLSAEYDYAEASEPIGIEVISKPEAGIVDTTVTFSMYNASREIGNNVNFVNETGLKSHVDELQEQIDDLDERVTTLESKVSVLENKVATLESDVASLKASVQANTSAIETNKQSIVTLTTKFNELESKVTTNTNDISSLKSKVDALESTPAE